ncbi:hypothetical protein OG422_19615 [Streptomyces sp. NBC_01525]|uniref:hypothetical protein n=1 Tax=Streptomyces TaxID=1883 RepID=UPI00163DC37E|nr:hypothetical protein [Streptomyces benahoarensis]
MHHATPHGVALHGAGVPHAPVLPRLRAALRRRWREAQRAAAMNVRTGTVKRGRA